MATIRSYENFPARLIAVTILVSGSISALGAFILAGFGNVMIAIYLLFCIGNEVHIMKKSCADCWYYGKWCAFGKGKLAALFFERGDTNRFPAKTMSVRDLTSDILVVIFPLVAGLALLIRSFSWKTGMALVLLLAFTTAGNYLIRSRIACACCKQRERGCPAEQFFSKRIS